jgi:hypothetical protein
MSLEFPSPQSFAMFAYFEFTVYYLKEGPLQWTDAGRIPGTEL